jgi:hypothetical protein
MKKAALIAVAAVAVLVGSAEFGNWLGHRPKNAPYHCTAGPGEICASDQFYKDYQHMLDLQEAVAKAQQSSGMRELQEKQDLSTGIASRLAQQIPQGYAWDRNKERFVKPPTPSVPTPPPATPPAAPAPANK